MSLDIGQVLGGRYAIERVLGRGTLGIVYQGRDQTTNQHVAIRLIKPEFDNEQVAAFNESEARTAGQLTSIHFARLINIGFLPTGERCILGEYIDGETLKNRVARLGRLSDLQVAQMLLQLLEGLAAAHGAGIIHRDLTPSSVMLAPRADGSGDHATLLDFGISRLQALTANPSAAKAAGIDPTSLQYLSPEQLNGLRGIDPRSNIYSLGTIAYEAITGRRPFEGMDFSDPSLAVLQEEPKPVEEVAPASNSPLAQLIRKAMARSPNARFQRADEMTTAISEWIRRAPAAPVATAQPIAPPIPVQLLAQAPVASPSPGAPEVAPASRPVVASSPAATPPMPSGITSVPPGSTSSPQGALPPEMVPPPMPPDEVLAQMAPVQTYPVPAGARPAAPPMPDAVAPAPAQVVPPAMTTQETPAAMAPASTRAVAATAPTTLATPAPPPLSEKEAAQAPDIDQSVVDALFAPAPVSRRNELDFGGTDDAGGAASDAKSSPVSDRLQPPRLEPTSSPGAARVPDVAADFRAGTPEFVAPLGSQSAPAVSPAVLATALASAGASPSGAETASSKSTAGAATAGAVLAERSSPSGAQAGAVAVVPSTSIGEAAPQFATANAPQQTLANESAEAPSADPAAALNKRTILGLGMGGTASVSSPPVEPAAARATASAPAPEPQQSTGRPPQATAPGIQPSSVSSSAPTVPKVGPVSAPAITAAVAPTAMGGATVASAALDDLGPYGKTQLRSRKPLVIALVLVGVVGMGAAIALLQGPSERAASNKSEPSQVSLPAARTGEVTQAKPAPTPSDNSRLEAASKESGAEPAKSGTSLSQAMNAGLLSQSVAAAQGKKPSSPAKPVSADRSVPAEKSAPIDKPAPAAKASAAAKPAALAKPAAKSSAAAPVPNKPAAAKAAGSDPYKYR